MIDTRELRGAANQMRLVCPCNDPQCTFASCIESAADEIERLRAENIRLQKELDNSEKWGREMNRLANQRSDLANTWMQRATHLRKVIEDAPHSEECDYIDNCTVYRCTCWKIKALEADPERFKAMNPPNGWGDYEGAIAFLKSIRVECEKHPEAFLKIT